MESKILVRDVTPNDFEFVYHSLCDLENMQLDKATIQELYEKNTAAEGYRYMLAEIDGVPAGFITFHTQYLMHHSGLVGEIQEFYVVPEWRGKGIGRCLINVIIAHGEQLNCKSIEVATNRRRVENVEVYQRLGFKLSHNKFTIYY